MSDTMERRVYLALNEAMDSKPSLYEKLKELLAINCAMLALLASDHGLPPLVVLALFDDMLHQIKELK